MQLETVLTGHACTTCALILANDDDSSMSEDEARSHRQTMADLWGETVESLCADGSFSNPSGWIVGEPIGFTSLPCDSCGTRLPGDRHEISSLGYVH